MHFLYFYRRVKAWTKAHFLYEALACFIQNVLRSTILHANKTTKKCIQFLSKMMWSCSCFPHLFKSVLFNLFNMENFVFMFL